MDCVKLQVRMRKRWVNNISSRWKLGWLIVILLGFVFYFEYRYGNFLTNYWTSHYHKRWQVEFISTGHTFEADKHNAYVDIESDHFFSNESKARDLEYAANAEEKYNKLAKLDQLANHSNPHCAMSYQFNSWQKGIVTQLGIPLKRDCQKLMKTHKAEFERVQLYRQVKNWIATKPWEQFALSYKNMSCEEIKSDFENNFYISKMEEDFPIAYIFVVYTNAGQILRLLKAIYRPHNLYCIHPDARQGKEFLSYFTAIANCLDNVFVVSNPVKVYYGHISITDAQLNCMQDLEKYPTIRWKYVINLCGREIPLKTNREIVQSLIKLNGYTALNLKKFTSHAKRSRFEFKFSVNEDGIIYQTNQPQSKPPKGIRLYKSMNFIAASRQFVNFILNNPLSIELHKYMSTVYAPEEHFYSSLYALPHAKGGKPPQEVVLENEIPIIDYFIWIGTAWLEKHVHDYCLGGKVVHSICILTALDLGEIEKFGINSKQTVFFFNKYYLEWDPTPMDCMEERLVMANIEEFKKDCVHS